MFVQRDGNNKIIGVFELLQPGYAEEELPSDSQEIKDFLDPPLTIDQIINQYTIAIEKHVDAVAASKNYADAVSLTSYANSTAPEWAAEAKVFIAWRDMVWKHAYAELAKVQNGQRPQPTIDEFLSELDTIIWPKE